MKYLLSILALCGLLNADAIAQNTTTTLNPSFDQIAPPSPNAASLGKFGSYPVGPSTGVPAVNIPIYTWEGKTFGKSVDVSLSYHAGGVQVDQQASNVGLGWALNAGGVITRTMRGIYDEKPVHGFLFYELPADQYVGNGPIGVSRADRIFTKMYGGQLDTQNDLFSFNFNGRSGSFVLGKNNDILLLERSKLKIEKFITNAIDNDPRITRFVITDELGYRFEFSDYEITATSASGLPPRHTSAWYLSKVTNPAGTNHIVFEYEDYLLSAIQIGLTQSEAHPLGLDGSSLYANLGGGSAQTVYGKRVTKIRFPDDMSVTFAYNSSMRADLPTNCTDKALEKITIENTTEKFGYRLNQNYSLAGRLTLISVEQFGRTESDTLRPYSFIYSSALLPPRFSPKKDHWGYPNANPSQSSIQKEYVLIGGNNGPYSPYWEYLGGVRDTDPDLVKAGSLVKIIYPTGGYTEFEMEANTAVDPWLNRAVTTEVSNPFTEQGTNMAFNNQGGFTNNTFTYTGVSNANISFTMSAPAIGCSGCFIQLEIYRGSGANPVAIQTMPLGSGSGMTATKNFTLASLNNGDTFYTKGYLVGYSAGAYYGYGTLTYRQQNPPGSTKIVTLGTNQLYVGGLRARTINEYSNIGNLVNSRQFEYLLEDGVTSSGSLGYRPIYSYQIKYDARYEGGFVTGDTYNFNPSKDYVIRSSSSVNEIPLINGAPVTYKRVVEKRDQNQVSNGKTVRTFSTFADNMPYISEDLPTIPAQYALWNYGQILSESLYDANNAVIQKTENQYINFVDGYSTSQSRVENFRSISIAPAAFVTSEVNPKVNPANPPGYFIMKSFTPVAGRKELNKSTVTDYVGGQPAQTTVTDFTYDADNFYIKEKRSTTSKVNDTLKTVYVYPQDMVNSNEDAVIYTGMLNSNMVNPVVKETYFRNNIQIGYKRTRYRNWSGSLYAPELVFTKSSNEPEEIRLRYLQYDLHGAPVALQKEYGAKSVYLWGYGGNRLIASLDNAEYGSISSLLGGAAVIESFRNLPAPSDAAIDNFLSQLNYSTLPATQIQKYKYSTIAGITSQIDEKGVITFYEYDGFQRLKAIKDQHGNIIKSYDYHYKP